MSGAGDPAVRELDESPGPRWVGYSVLIVLYLAVGYGVSRGTRFSESLRGRPRPPFSPPPAAFAAVWPVLYILAGYSVCRVAQRATRTRPRWQQPSSWPYWVALAAAALHLCLSNLWLSVYAKGGLYKACFVLLALVLAVALQLYSSALVDRLAGFLLVPMFVWLLYALMMNAAAVGLPVTG